MSKPSRKAAGKTAKKSSFHRELVLNRWMMGFFRGINLTTLKARLEDERHEGMNEDGQTRFFHELIRNLFEPGRISGAELRRYDLNIARHWQAITRQRNKLEGHTLRMKYFQYLSLLFTEIYLDWYFNKRSALLEGLNTEMARYRAEPDAMPFRDFEAEDLNKIAYWSATGSGKTLLLHVNIHQYLHYFRSDRKGYPDKIILLTPNEDLSRQHLEELHLSGLGFAQHFNKVQTPAKGTIEIIDINKLGDEMGDKTVAVSAFEGNNLVLVDEGHRGTGAAAAWMIRRDALIQGGFAFEYSATFGQAVAKGWTMAEAEEDIRKKQAKMLFGIISLKNLDEAQRARLVLSGEEKRNARVAATREVYAKCILFDYSYRFFYEDGYGKESLILNMNDEAYAQEENARMYFTACLLAFYQQLWLWDRHRDAIADFNIEKPLWVFVGNTVQSEESDILEVVRFLACFLNHETQVRRWLSDLIADNARLLDAKGNHIFHNRFVPLMGFRGSENELYADILRRVFHAPARQRLKLVNIKSSRGELALRVGDAPPFGVINIGDDTAFFRLAEGIEDFDNEADDFGSALFDTINQKESRINVLVGSRKFTEGWSSWRVSTMGLLNMGRGEGTQIIQLFGRGVRLKGRGFSLKRSAEQERPKGLFLDKLETLNIFGVRANYMATFKDYLRAEGVTPSDEILELDFPTRSSLPPGKLKTLALKDGYKDNQKRGFKWTHFPWLYEIPAVFQGKIRQPHVTLDLYPRIEALSASGESGAMSATRPPAKLDASLFSVFNWDRIYLALQDHKLQRGMTNLRLDREKLIAFCHASADWYTLFIPESGLALSSFGSIKKQEDILIQLLTDYTDRFYKTLKTAYEGQFYDVIRMDENHGSMLKSYHFEINKTDVGEAYQQRLGTLKALVADGKIGEAGKWEANHMVAISFDRHLYYPLFGLKDKNAVPLKLRPLALEAESEWTFVKDLEAFYDSPAGRAAIGSRSLYLLRNADRQEKGLGFALAGNFYPDFLLWLVDDNTGQQWLTFVDPKGLRNVDLEDPKLRLYKEVKMLEETLEKQAKPGEGKLVLNAFILSSTAFSGLLNIPSSISKENLEARHVLFMADGGTSYLKEMFSRIV